MFFGQRERSERTANEKREPCLLSASLNPAGGGGRVPEFTGTVTRWRKFMSRRSLWVAVPVAALLVCGAVAWLIWRDAHRRVEALTTPREETVPIAIVVTRVRDLSRLETAAMHVVHISKISQTYQLVPDAIAGDELTFFAAGDVIAGIDLGQLRDGDVSRDTDGTLVVRLPPPQ